MPSSPDPTPAPAAWRPGARAPLARSRPAILGILNLTPDSFADGGRLPTPAAAAAAALRMAREGADALDLGAESTRPGAHRIPADEQLARLLPALAEARRAGVTLPITVDTTLAEVAAAALAHGADAINDVSAGEESGDETLRLAAHRGCGIILMHRLAPPGADAYSDRYRTPPAYADVVAEVAEYLTRRAARALELGVRRDGILLDPGLGFGKSVEQNLTLLAGTPALVRLGFPVLSALSRKSFVGRASLGRDSTPAERLPGTLALSAAHFQTGASVFRVHDVAEHRAALDALAAIPRRNDTPRA